MTFQHKNKDTNVWVGLHDRDVENEFYWVDGTPLGKYTNWVINEPTPNVRIKNVVKVTISIIVFSSVGRQ